MKEGAVDITRLTPEEKLVLIGELWDSLSSSDVPLTKAQRTELDRRLDLLDAEGVAGSPWDEVEARVRRPKR